MKVTNFNIEKEEFPITKSDIEFIDEFDIEVSNGKMVYYYVNIDTSEGNLELDIMIIDELEINEEEYLALVDKYKMTNHPTIPMEASYFLNKKLAEGFVKEVKEMFIQAGMMEK